MKHGKGRKAGKEGEIMKDFMFIARNPFKRVFYISVRENGKFKKLGASRDLERTREIMKEYAETNGYTLDDMGGYSR